MNRGSWVVTLRPRADVFCEQTSPVNEFLSSCKRKNESAHVYELNKEVTLVFRMVCFGLVLWCFVLSLTTSCGNPTATKEATSDASQHDVATSQEASSEPTIEPDISPEKTGIPEENKTEAIPEEPQQPCFYDQPPGKNPQPNYKQYNPTIGKHCDGTNHQKITKIEQVVFVGDSITKGTPPTPEARYFRNSLTVQLKKKFGNNITIKNCSKWGARNDDLLLKPQKQLQTCLPNPIEKKRTLVIFTSGGNDMQSYAKSAQKGVSLTKILEKVKQSTKLLRDAVEWVKDPKRFPNGSFVVFGNIYEFTDGTGDVASCKASKAVGLDKPWPEGRSVYVAINEAYMKIAVETKSDIFFLLERFCGHGFHYQDKSTECYLPNAKRWFDFTCIHPNPDGHDQITKMIMNIINE